MVDDATTLLEPLKTPVHEKTFVEMPFDVVISQ
jgi:hypothetical protein